MRRQTQLYLYASRRALQVAVCADLPEACPPLHLIIDQSKTCSADLSVGTHV